MNSILGDFVAGGKGGTINVVWEIKEGNKIVTKGSNIDFGYSPVFSSGYYGLTIGEFNAISGIEYVLSLYVKSVNPEWDQCKPYIEVGLHPAKMEYLLVYQIFGVILFVTFSGILGIVFLVYVVQKRRNLENKISA